jgi:7,8-dihydropterin-6-yl-methyl-4-(beta-D-ribofuranosyl)aminobenzene 5'-phosphate synthase
MAFQLKSEDEKGIMARVICVVDNAAPARTGLKTEHGVAFWIETENGIVLFDTGASAAALKVNMRKIGLAAADITALAFSHAHYDHTGGIEAILEEREGLPAYANADIFRPKYSRHEGNYDASGFERQAEDYLARADWRLNDSPIEILDGVWTTGRIFERTFPEGRSSGHHIRQDGAFVPDPYWDDMSLVLQMEDGLAVVCGCCHAGILNTLAHVRSHFDGEIRAVLGGIHLMPADGPLIRRVIGRLQEVAPNARFWLNHCTGDKALEAFGKAFTDKAHHFLAGEHVDL